MDQQPLLDNKSTVDHLLLALCPGITLAGAFIGELVGGADVIRLYAWYTLIVHLVMIYIPTHRIFSNRTDENVFGARRIGVAEIFCAMLLGVGITFLMTALQTALQQGYMLLGYTGGSLGGAPGAEGWRFAALLLLVGLIPAYTYEALFRGALLFSWLPRGRGKALLHSALLFSLLMLNPMMLPALAPYGLLLGLVSLWSGSFHPAVIMHATNNLLAILSTRWIGTLTGEAKAFFEGVTPGQVILWYGLIGVVASALFLTAYYFIAKKARARRAAQPLPAETPPASVPPAKAPPAEEREPAGLPRQAALPPGLFRRQPVVTTYIYMVAINLFYLLLTLMPAA